MTIGAAASMQELLQEICKHFKKNHPDMELSLNFASSHTIAQQIKHKAPIDIFLSADSHNIDLVLQQGFGASESRVAFASNSLVLIVPKHSQNKISSPQDLLHPNIKLIGACPDVVPIGKYTKNYLEDMAILQKLQKKFVYTDHVRSILSLVGNKAVQAGFVYASDVRKMPDRVSTAFSVPQSALHPILYEGIIVKKNSNFSQGKEFLNFLRSPQGQKIVKNHGFIPLKALFR